MTIDEAIRIIEDEIGCWALHPETSHPKAFQLGIEALKFRQRWEQQEGEADFSRLPGETEE